MDIAAICGWSCSCIRWTTMTYHASFPACVWRCLYSCFCLLVWRRHSHVAGGVRLPTDWYDITDLQCLPSPSWLASTRKTRTGLYLVINFVGELVKVGQSATAVVRPWTSEYDVCVQSRRFVGDASRQLWSSRLWCAWPGWRWLRAVHLLPVDVQVGSWRQPLQVSRRLLCR